jgi:trehalose synthase-fused probable maltokinase
VTIDLSGIVEQLPSQRWFGDKTREIAGASVVDHAEVSEGLIFAIATIRFTDGSEALYSLPLVIGEDGSVRGAADEPGRLLELGRLMASGASVAGEHGTFHFSGAGLDPLAPPGNDVRVMDAEQSNTSIVIDERVILKLLRRVDWGPNPDLELSRILTSEGFDFIPPQVGEISYEQNVEGTSREVDLGIAQQFLTDGREGWDATLTHLRRVLDEIHPSDVSEDMRVLIDERSSELLRAIEDLGDVTGSLHVLLAREEFDPDLRAEPIEPMDLKEWTERTRSLLNDLLPQIPELDRLQEPIETRLNALTDLAEPGLKARVHGDYHLGQVLHTSRGWMILDFEGEPARPLEERRAKQSPLKDVAGMLRSFSYASFAVLFERSEPGSEEWQRLRPWARCWEQLARERFLSGYLTRSHEGIFLPADVGDIALMLDFFEIDKALYELGYELGHRPEWMRIPLEGLTQAIERGIT